MSEDNMILNRNKFFNICWADGKLCMIYLTIKNIKENIYYITMGFRSEISQKFLILESYHHIC